MFALPVSFVYGKYSVRVKRKIFWKVRVGVRAARAIVGGMGGLRGLRGLRRLPLTKVLILEGALI